MHLHLVPVRYVSQPGHLSLMESSRIPLCLLGRIAGEGISLGGGWKKFQVKGLFGAKVATRGTAKKKIMKVWQSAEK